MGDLGLFVASLPWAAALLSGLGGFVAAARQDRETFKKWFLRDPGAEFDWPLALRRWALGFATGFLTVMAPSLGVEVLS